MSPGASPIPIGPAFEGFAPVAGTLPFDLEPATFRLVQAAKVFEMSTEPALMSLTAVAQAIAQKKISSREATQSCLDRVAQWQPQPQRLHGDRSRRRAEGGRRRRCRAGERQVSRRAARRAAGAQGHVLRRRPRRHLRLENPQGFRRHHDRHGAAAAEGRRHGSARLAADGGVRLWADRPQPALRAGA